MSAGVVSAPFRELLESLPDGVLVVTRAARSSQSTRKRAR